MKEFIKNFFDPKDKINHKIYRLSILFLLAILSLIYSLKPESGSMLMKISSYILFLIILPTFHILTIKRLKDLINSYLLIFIIMFCLFALFLISPVACIFLYLILILIISFLPSRN